MRINPSGNVGIGATDPSQALTISRSSGANSVIYLTTDTGQAGVRLLAGTGTTNRATRIDFLNGVASGTTPRWTLLNDYSQNGTNDFRFINSDTSTSVLTLLQNGNVFIGTTSPSQDLDIRKTKVGSTVSLRIRNDSTSADSHATINLAVNEASSDPYIAFDYAQANLWILGVDGSDSDKFKLSNNGSTYLPGAGDILTVTTGGSVGINTTSPTMRFQVADVGATISGGNAISTSTMKGIRLENTNNSTESVGLWFNTGGNHWSGISGQRTTDISSWSTDLRFYTHETNTVDLTYARERMRISSEGNVGIGSTSPLARLSISQDTDA
jgi:hypothetical protein